MRLERGEPLLKFRDEAAFTGVFHRSDLARQPVVLVYGPDHDGTFGPSLVAKVAGFIKSLPARFQEHWACLAWRKPGEDASADTRSWL
jgi:hypothetical protein